MSLRLIFFPLLLSVVLVACNPLASSGSGGSQGVCETADGSVVNTYSVFGTWKKIQGYDPPRTATELELNYDLLMVLPGSTMCLVKIENGAAVSTEFVASYSHDVNQKQLGIEVLNAEGQEPMQANYSFAGSCNRTQMTLSYVGTAAQSSTSERYEVVSKDTASLNCGL